MHRPPHVLPTVVAAQFACTSVWFAGNAVLPDLQAELGLSGLLGWTTSGVQFGFIVGTLVMAITGLADRVPAPAVFAGAALGAGLSNLGLLAADDLPTLVAARVATGICLAGVYPVGMKIAASWTERGLGTALGFLVGALVLGTALPHGLRALGADMDWRAVVVATSVLAISGGLLLGSTVREGPHTRRSSGLQLGAVRSLFSDRVFRASALAYFGHMWELYAVWALLPAVVAAHDPTVSASAWTAGTIAVGFLGCAGGGLAAVRVGGARVAGVQMVIGGVLTLTAPLWITAPTPLFAGLLALWGVAVIGDSPQLSALTAKAAPPHLVGTGLTVVTCIGFALTVVSVELAEALPLTWALVVLALGPLVGLLAMRPLFQAEAAVPHGCSSTPSHSSDIEPTT